MTTTQARQDTLGEATLGELAEGLRGELIRPTDPLGPLVVVNHTFPPRPVVIPCA